MHREFLKKNHLSHLSSTVNKIYHDIRQREQCTRVAESRYQNQQCTVGDFYVIESTCLILCLW